MAMYFCIRIPTNYSKYLKYPSKYVLTYVSLIFTNFKNLLFLYTPIKVLEGEEQVEEQQEVQEEVVEEQQQVEEEVVEEQEAEVLPEGNPDEVAAQEEEEVVEEQVQEEVQQEEVVEERLAESKAADVKVSKADAKAAAA
jgi:hypothetical protein